QGDFAQSDLTEQQEDEDLSGTPAPPVNLSPGMAREVAEFHIVQAYDTSHAVAKGNSRWSALEGAATVMPGNWISMGSQLGYDSHDARVSYSSIYFTMQPWWKLSTPPSLYMGRAVNGSFLQLSFNYIASDATALQPGIKSTSFQFIALRAYYDLTDRM